MKAIFLSSMIALIAGIIVGYFVERVISGYHGVQLALAAENAIGMISIELGKYHELHGSYPNSLSDLDIESMNLSESDHDLFQKAFYLQQNDSYALIIGIPAAAWSQPGQNVRFR